NASFKFSNPYGSANPFQTEALFNDHESVWRAIGTARMKIDAISTASQTLSLIATGGGDVFTQKNRIYAPSALQFTNAASINGGSVLSFAQNQNFNVATNAVHTLKSSAFTATTQVGMNYET